MAILVHLAPLSNTNSAEASRSWRSRSENRGMISHGEDGWIAYDGGPKSFE